MPSMVAHMFCGEKAFTISGCERIRNIIKANKNAFYLGCQGPDPFMYYGILPGIGRKLKDEYRSISDLLHYGRPSNFFKGAIEYLKNKGTDVQVAYVCGYLCHHALDSTAHPYIYYETATTKDIPNDYAHSIMERAIDYAVLKDFGLTVKEFKPHKKLIVKEDELLQINELNCTAIENGFGKVVDRKLALYSYKDMVKCESVVYDPYGAKKPYVVLLEKIFNKPNLGVSMLIPREYDEKTDPMNYRKDIWYDPVDKTPHYETFMDLFNIAALKTANRMLALENYLEDKETVDDVLAVIGEDSYETGRSDGAKMVYFKRDLQE